MRILFFSLCTTVFLFCTPSEKKAPIVSTKTAPTNAILPSKNTVLPISSPINMAYLTGKFLPDTAADFALIAMPTYTDRPKMYLQKEAYEAFREMHAQALKEGVKLKIISATRNFDYQKDIWERKWAANAAIKDPAKRAKKILEFSAMPSCSRHHWGTDIDLNDLNNPYFEKGTGKKIYDWLTKNAADYGFGQPYTAGRSVGYKEEKWHWSYLPIARKFSTFAQENMTTEDIKGFKGAETAQELEVIQNYVLGINPDCL